MKKLLILALATLITQQAVATNWFLLNEDDINKDYIDLDSIQADYLTNDTPVMTAWSQTEYKQAQDIGNGKKIWSSKNFIYFDCRARKSDTEYLAGYDKQGKVVASGNIPSFSRYSSINWERVIPDSLGEIELNTVCAYAN